MKNNLGLDAVEHMYITSSWWSNRSYRSNRACSCNKITKMMSVVIGSCFTVNWRIAGVSQWFDLCVRVQDAKCDRESLRLRLPTKTKKNCPLIDNNQREILD